ncbi:hypothetical protein AYO38_03875 [bacterium SCGC AG-212-C10]|nr:hypothetical protein AYO38_03875 [bacterium SCGC AG-212-C10]
MDEVHTSSAIRLLTSDWTLCAPRFLAVELHNVLMSKTRGGILTAPQGGAYAAQIDQLPVRWLEDRRFLYFAHQLALSFHPSVYDCLYAATAITMRGKCVTADRQFYDRLAPPYPETMLWIEDIP